MGMTLKVVSAGKHGHDARSLSDPFSAVIGCRPLLSPNSGQLGENEPISLAAQAMNGINVDKDDSISSRALQSWVGAYNLMAMDARELGIPGYAIAEVSNPTTVQELRLARTKLTGIIASFTSANI